MGKTIPAKTFAADPANSTQLGLDTAEAMDRLANPTAFLAANRQRLVVPDGRQNRLRLLGARRGEIDAGRRPDRFLLQGSAAFKLLRQSRSLAGRPALADMSRVVWSGGLQSFDDTHTLWPRGMPR